MDFSKSLGAEVASDGQTRWQTLPTSKLELTTRGQNVLKELLQGRLPPTSALRDLEWQEPSQKCKLVSTVTALWYFFFSLLCGASTNKQTKNKQTNHQLPIAS